MTKIGVQSLTLRMAPRVGHICHVKGGDVDLDHTGIAGATRVSASKSSMSLQMPEWTELGICIDAIGTQIQTEETDIFRSFATLAREWNHVRPLLNLGVSHEIVGGRHSPSRLDSESIGQVASLFLPDEKSRLGDTVSPLLASDEDLAKFPETLTIVLEVDPLR
ncbi:hypothetical protein HOY82DRAFT_631635 [Tuber indicum]|nr:hypothetical protein HOY82DRAFT_631635 [Tuber indicum]